MEDKEKQPPLIEQLTQYAETRFKLAKYKAIDSSSTFIGSIVADIIVIGSIVLALIFASFTLAFYLAHVLDSYWEGFGCVALLYIIIAIVCKVYKAAFEKPIANAFIQKFFKN